MERRTEGKEAKKEEGATWGEQKGFKLLSRCCLYHVPRPVRGDVGRVGGLSNKMVKDRRV